MNALALQLFLEDKQAALASAYEPAPLGAARLSPNFTVAEFERSSTARAYGITNRFSWRTRQNAKRLCMNILEPIRFVLDAPIAVSSGLRVKKLNTHKAIGGSSTSEHVKGYAADIGTPVLSDPELFDLMRLFQLPFGQIIEEFRAWVHVSYTPHRRRHQALYARVRPGRSNYYSAPGIKVTPKMTAIVKAFQERVGLKPDGIVGKNTRAAARNWASA